MLGIQSGVMKLMKDRFPSLIVWHCANHGLELSLGGSISGFNYQHM
jgi:hypothetical protein